MKEIKNKEKTIVVGCRLPVNLHSQFEITTLENRTSMSKIMRDAVNDYLNKKLPLNN